MLQRNGLNQMILAVVGGLLVAGITALVVLSVTLSSRMAAIETSIAAFDKRIAKLENDVYTPRFTKSRASNHANGAKANPSSTPAVSQQQPTSAVSQQQPTQSLQ